LLSEPVDEELLPGNRIDCFHPTRAGEILDGRFRAIVKLGFGTGSVVWLAENLKL
jgi:serine/threonine-protein kinase SRPK3